MTIVLDSAPIAAPAPALTVPPATPVTPDAAATPTPPQADQQATTVPEGLVSDLPKVAQDLLQVTMIISTPDWAMRPPSGTKLVANGLEVVGKHTSGSVKIDVHEKFVELTNNNQKLTRVRDKYTILDTGDQLRYVSAFAKEQMVEDVILLHEERRLIWEWFDAHWEDTILPRIRQEHGEHWEWMEPRLNKLYRPPFGQRLGVILRFREQAAVSPDAFDLTKVSPTARTKVTSLIAEQADAYARDQVRMIIDGAMQPILDLAKEINGEMPNPKYDPTKPTSHKHSDGSKNTPYLAGINSGRKRDGFIAELMTTLDRVVNFRQFMTPEVLQQVDRAKQAVEQAGGDITKVNASTAIQSAISKEMSRLSQVMKQNIGDGPIRRQRTILG